MAKYRVCRCGNQNFGLPDIGSPVCCMVCGAYYMDSIVIELDSNKRMTVSDVRELLDKNDIIDLRISGKVRR